MNLNAKHTALLFLLPFLLTACPSSGGPEQCPNRAASGASICGTISVSSNTFADSDVNDIYAGDYWVANNDANSAQNISNPALVGGYINTAGAGPTGHLQSSGDIADFYKVKLKAGDTVKLYIADAAQNLDLYLYDTNLLEKALSIGITQVESVTAPAAGDFYIKVVAVSAASNYTLTVGITQIATANEYFSNLDFAPGEILVRFQDEKLPLGVMRAEAQSDMVGLQHLSGAPGRVQLLGLGDVAQRQQAAQLLGIQSVPVVGRYADPIVQLKLETMQAVQALRKRSDVLSADLNYHHDLLAVPTDTYYSNQWHYPLIDLPLAWEDLTRGSGAIVAVIDTGIINHPDLAGQLSPDGGYDFISSSSIANDGNGIDSDPTDTGDKVAPKTRSTFHGTHVAGTIAAATCFSGSCGGVAGVAPGAKIMPLRVMGQGGGYDTDIMQAMLYAAGLNNNSGTTPQSRGGQKADIINMSLGGGGYSSTFQTVVNQVRAAGVIVIAASGNDGISTVSYPAAYDGVVAVSAVDRNKALASYSNYGTKVDVTAPGGEQSTGMSNGVLSTLGDDSSGSTVYTYGYYQGTSMATPHVAGVAALMVGYANAHVLSMSPAVFDAKLAAGELTEDLVPAGYDTRFGWGLINANKALASAGLVLDIPPVIQVNPATADLGGIASSKTITVTNGSIGVNAAALTGVTVATDGSSWLSVSTGILADIAVGGSTTFTISIDRTGLADGYYSGSISLAASNAPPVVVQVLMAQGSTAGDAGYQYITLVNADTGLLVEQTPTSRDPVYGSYNFSFANVPDGHYFIVSGTDMDNDYVICDEGEACGSYPDIGVITVSGADVTGIQFETGYYVPFGLTTLQSTNSRKMPLRKLTGSTTKAIAR